VRELNADGAPTCASVAGTDFTSQSQNYVFAAPSGAAGTPSFRALVDADIPDDITVSGYVPTSRQVATSSPLQGGGALSSDLTLSILQAGASQSGYLSSADWNTFNGKENALTFNSPLSRSTNTISCPTCEITGNKNAASGYAGLTAATKLNASQGQEVWAIADLTDFTGKSGSGTTAIGATITTPASTHYLGWDGSNWINRAIAAGDLPSHTHAASDITSGTLALARGGTNQSSWIASRCVRVNDAGTALEVASGDCGTGGGGGDNISVNGTAATDADFDDSTPAAPANSINVRWQKDTSSPNNISANVPYASPLTVSGGNLTLNQNAGTDVTADLEEEQHASEHQHGGSDEIATATPGANAIPKAGADGTLADGWLSNTVTKLGQTIEDSELASNYSGVGSCGSNQWASALNDNAAPTCTQPSFSNLSGSATLAQLPVGTANQILGTNAGATSQEHKTLSTGTSGTDFAIAHAANSITFNLPVASASATGKLSSTDWSTFNSKQAGDADLTALSNLSGTGFARRTGADTWATYAASGTGSCTNQVVTGLNDNAAPTCSNVFSAMIPANEIAVSDVTAVLRTRQAGFMIGADNASSALADSDDQTSIWVNRLGQGVTVTEVWCDCDAGSPQIQLQKDDGTPTNMLSSNLTCSTGSGASTTSFVSGENAIANGDRIDFVMVTAGGSAKRVTVSFKYTLD